MISGYLIGDRAMVARFGDLPAATKLKLDLTTQALGFELEARVKAKYLRGPRPTHLGVVTGRLLSSIAKGGPESRSRFESKPFSATYYVGTNVEYGAAWEFGFSRKVGAGARGGPRYLSDRAFTGSALSTYFSKHPPGVKQIAARPFLHPALDDMRAHIQEKMSAALKTAAREGLRK